MVEMVQEGRSPEVPWNSRREKMGRVSDERHLAHGIGRTVREKRPRRELDHVYKRDGETEANCGGVKGSS